MYRCMKESNKIKEHQVCIPTRYIVYACIAHCILLSFSKHRKTKAPVGTLLKVHVLRVQSM